jgi:hypothetical protein
MYTLRKTKKESSSNIFLGPDYEVTTDFKVKEGSSNGKGKPILAITASRGTFVVLEGEHAAILNSNGGVFEVLNVPAPLGSKLKNLVPKESTKKDTKKTVVKKATKTKSSTSM